jgi:hypothetical protein
VTALTHRYLSLGGAGVQISTLLLLAAQGRIPRFDAAVFADTSWEPAAVYENLDRLSGIAEQAGIEVVRVSAGDTRSRRAWGCPFHDDGFWLALRENSPSEWADAVAFDRAVRHGSARANAAGQPLRGQFFLHRQRVPLDEVVLRSRTQMAAAPGCGPWTCPHDVPAEAGADGGEVA